PLRHLIIARVVAAAEPAAQRFAVARIVFARGIGVFACDQAILRVGYLAVGGAPEVLDEGARARTRQHVAGGKVDGEIDELPLGLVRRRIEHGPGRIGGPYALDDRREDRQRHLGPGLAGAERAALAVGVVIADPHRHRDLVGEADEPRVVFLIAGAGL